MKRLIYSGLFFFTVILLSGCVKRELELPAQKLVRINFDWSHLDEHQIPPAEVVIRFYNPEGEFLFERTSGSDYFEGYVPEGEYKILVYNPDSTDIRHHNMESFEDAQISLEDGTQEAPSPVYGGTIEALTVPAGEPTDATIVIHPYLHQVSVHVNITGNSEEVAECVAVIDGLAEGVNLSTGLPVNGTNSSASVKLYPHTGSYHGIFRLAGNNEQYPSAISFKIRFKDGTERIIRQNFDDFMNNLGQRPSDTPLSVEFTIDVQSIDGVLTATLKDWVYKQGEVTLN